MKEKQKSLITTFLLVVGVLFILVSGGIFVTTAWQYLPEVVKQFALLGVSLGLFAGSFGLTKSGKLKKTSFALFYLGVAFTGFFVIAIMGGISCESIETAAFRMLMANLVMLLPISIKLLAEKHAFEYAVLSVMVDGIIITGCAAFELDVDAYLVMQAGYLIVLAAMDYIQQKRMAVKNNLELCVGVVYLVHAICFTVMTFWFTLIDFDEIASILAAAAIVAATAVSWSARKMTVVRVCNSISIFWFVYVAVSKVVMMLDVEAEYQIAWFVIVVIHSLIVVCMKRTEMLWMQVFASVAMPAVQLFFYWSEAWSLWGGVDELWSITYYPYSLVYAVSFLALYVMENRRDVVATAWKQKIALKLAGLQFITGMVMWLTSKETEMFVTTFFLLGVNVLLTGASIVEQDIAKKIFKMFALFAGAMAIIYQPFVKIPDEYIVEWFCLIIAISIVLFRVIWYNMKEQFGILYFITTCILLGVLLLHNLYVEGIGNVLILGMTGIVMLVTAAIKNNRKYVIASSITLIILVLYLTREFWLSIAWWVYLFVAGVVLVSLAIKKEKEV